jgi:hypothetical protein
MAAAIVFEIFWNCFGNKLPFILISLKRSSQKNGLMSAANNGAISHSKARLKSIEQFDLCLWRLVWRPWRANA